MGLTKQELIAKRDAIMAELEAYNAEKAIKEEWYHRNSCVKDELNRLIEVEQSGAKPTDLIAIETVAAEIAAKLKTELVKEPVMEIKEG